MPCRSAAPTAAVPARHTSPHAGTLDLHSRRSTRPHSHTLAHVHTHTAHCLPPSTDAACNGSPVHTCRGCSRQPKSRAALQRAPMGAALAAAASGRQPRPTRSHQRRPPSSLAARRAPRLVCCTLAAAGHTINALITGIQRTLAAAVARNAPLVAATISFIVAAWRIRRRRCTIATDSAAGSEPNGQGGGGQLRPRLQRDVGAVVSTSATGPAYGPACLLCGGRGEAAEDFAERRYDLWR
jgi:hypothetical protein